MNGTKGRRTRARRDLACIVFATAGFALICMWLEVSENVLAWTRPHERFQLDELPGILVFLAVALAWYAWRRLREAQAELALRERTEAKLREALARNRDLAHANMQIEDEERRSLARELHDELGQYLNAVKIDAVCLRDGEGSHIPEVRDGAKAIILIMDHLDVVVRAIVRRLRPPGLDELGLAAALDDCVEAWRRRLPGVQISMAVAEGIDDMDEATNMALYRLVQEGLTNVAKHARASRVEIVMQRFSTVAGTSPASNAEVVLTLRDDGAGTREGENRNGLGLAGMRERVEALSGRFDLMSTHSGGFGFTASLPVQAAAA